MDEITLDVVILDKIKFVVLLHMFAFCYMFVFYYICSLLILCVVFKFPKGVLISKLCAMDEVLDDPYVSLIP